MRRGFLDVHSGILGDGEPPAGPTELMGTFIVLLLLVNFENFVKFGCCMPEHFTVSICKIRGCGGRNLGWWNLLNRGRRRGATSGRRLKAKRCNLWKFVIVSPKMRFFGNFSKFRQKISKFLFFNFLLLESLHSHKLQHFLLWPLLPDVLSPALVLPLFSRFYVVPRYTTCWGSS